MIYPDIQSSIGSPFGFSALPEIRNEPIKSYAPGTHERADLKAALQSISSECPDLPMFIGGKEVTTKTNVSVVMPHDHRHILGTGHLATEKHVHDAVTAANTASVEWSRMPWQDRAAIFLKAADLLSGPWRAKINAATMHGQSKTVHQAEIDSAAELADFWRFNVKFMTELYAHQPISPATDRVWNMVDYRPLEGFVLAITPFNFTAIAGNLPSAPALMGNTVIWKPATTALLSAHYVMQLLREAGLPDGVINLVQGSGQMIGSQLLTHKDLAGVHFTGSTAVFDQIVKQVGADSRNYRTYPRIIGETGGKNFILAHSSANIDSLTIAIIRGAFEYQGQKCSAASRVFCPKSLWPELKERLCDQVSSIKLGNVADFENFMGAVIDGNAFNKHMSAIEEAKASSDSRILTGGNGWNEVGYFVSPTIIETTDLSSRILNEELFGPIVGVFVYEDCDFDKILDTIDEHSKYALTGAIFANDHNIIRTSLDRLRNSAGNVYINDKPTGAVVGQQPFGGARASGTNDKAGSMWNLMRWTSPRTIKETFSAPTTFEYPSMLPENPT
ncbi:MAG: L-glutamate gamma-semialdehyde dehydrogenase [Rhodobacteraceae bacterium]|nr:L-glutamate gamma-semialdehyde dehydrogenase [Paracoccaceae bacterium]